MKKTLLLIALSLSVVVFVFAPSLQAAGAEKAQTNQNQADTYETRTYQLKNITPRDVEALKAYYVKSSYTHTGGMITIVIRRDLIAQFEKLLKQLDQPRRSVQLNVFTFLASPEKGKLPEVGKDLQDVLKELSKVLAFKSFLLDGTSSLMVQEGQRHGRLLLSSKYELEFQLGLFTISNDPVGKRKTRFEFNLKGPYMQTGATDTAKEKKEKTTLISSTVTLEENGYLVAGISKLGPNGHSLVLILHATIR